MIATLISALQCVIAQYLDRRSLHRFATAHRNLLHILSDPRSYIVNSTYRPRYIGELNADLQSIGTLPATETNQTSTAFPSHLTSPASRKVFLSSVRSVDLRYCRDSLKLAFEVPKLLSLVTSVTNLSLQGHWTYALSEDEGANDYYEDDQTPLRQLLLQLPLRYVQISGPVWEKEIGVLNELRDLVSFHVTPDLMFKLPSHEFRGYPSLTSASLTDEAFEMFDEHDNTNNWFSSLRSLHLTIGLHDYSVAIVPRLSLTSLLLDLPFNANAAQINKIRLLLAPNTPLSRSLTTLKLSDAVNDLDIFELAFGFPCLTSLSVAYRRVNPNTKMMKNIIALTEANSHLQTLDLLLPGSLLSDKDTDSYFPVELSHKPPFSGALSWRFQNPFRYPAETTLPFLRLPFLSSISILEITNVTINYVEGENLASLNALHTAKLCYVRCTISPLHWLKRISPNVRHLHLQEMESNSASICSLFPDLLSLELRSYMLTEDDPHWLDNFARLPLRCIALGGQSDESHYGEGIFKIGEWMQRILLEANSPSFVSLRYVLFISFEEDLVENMSEIVPLLPQVYAARPHVQMDIRDTAHGMGEFLLDYEQCMHLCDS